MAERVRFRDRVCAFIRAFTEPPRAPDPDAGMYTSTTVTRSVTINGKVIEGPEADEITAEVAEIMARYHVADLDKMFAEIDEVLKRNRDANISDPV